MASVCGGCLALQDAGVPVKCSIAGIAMGMVLDTEEFGGDGTPLILSDITGSEDASGDMDFKVIFLVFLDLCSYSQSDVYWKIFEMLILSSEAEAQIHLIRMVIAGCWK